MSGRQASPSLLHLARPADSSPSRARVAVAMGIPVAFAAPAAVTDGSDGAWTAHRWMAFSCARNEGSEMVLSQLSVRSFNRVRKARGS